MKILALSLSFPVLSTAWIRFQLPQHPSTQRLSRRNNRMIPKAALPGVEAIGEIHHYVINHLPQLVSDAAALPSPSVPEGLTEGVQGFTGGLSDAFSKFSVRQFPDAQGFLNSLPKIEVPEQVSGALKAAQESAPGAADKLKELAEGLKGTVSAIKENKGLPSLPSFDEVSNAPLANELKGKLGEAQGQLSEAAKGKLSELKGSLGSTLGPKISEYSGKAADQFQKALTPYQPLIDDATSQISAKLSTVKELADQVTSKLTKEQAVLAESASPALRTLKSVATPRAVFNVENAIALPFWGALILAPNNSVVKKLMSSYFPIFLAIFAYIWTAYLAFQDPVSLEGFSGITNLGALTKGFSSETSVATAWAHFIAQDLFVGRWIYLDGMRNRVWTAHSLTLAFLFGPTGILSHIVTRGFVKIFRWDVEDIMVAGSATVAPSAAEGAAKATIKEAESKAKAALRASSREGDKIREKAKKEAKKIVSDAKTQTASATQEQEKIRAMRREAGELLGRARAEATNIKSEAKREAESLLSSIKAKASAAAATAPSSSPSPQPKPVDSSPKSAPSAAAAAPAQGPSAPSSSAEGSRPKVGGPSSSSSSSKQ